MFETLFNITNNTNENLNAMLISIVAAFISGFAISFVYIKTNKSKYSQSLATTLVFMPAVVSTIIMTVGGSIAAAFSLAGIFTIIRFRSAPASAKDIMLILFGVGAGLAYGVQSYASGIVFTVIVLAVQITMHLIGFATIKNDKLKLKIVSPDSSNNEENYATILKSHAISFELEKIGTRDLGSVYELVYLIEIDKSKNRKELIDELRCLNSNLNISITSNEINEYF